MRFPASRKIHYDSGPNLTPLVDVVMVILIFLMLVGSFGASEHFRVRNRPIKQTGPGRTTPPAGWVADTTLEIRVDPRGAGFEAVAGRIRVTDARQLEEQLRRMLEQFQQAGTPPDKVQVIIGPGKVVRYEHLIRVYESALSAGFTKVAFATSH
jgi:biopolymer transport protein ExbD